MPLFAKYPDFAKVLTNTTILASCAHFATLPSVSKNEMTFLILLQCLEFVETPLLHPLSAEIPRFLLHKCFDWIFVTRILTLVTYPLFPKGFKDKFDIVDYVKLHHITCTSLKTLGCERCSCSLTYHAKWSIWGSIGAAHLNNVISI